MQYYVVPLFFFLYLFQEHNRLEEGTLTEYKVKTLGTAQAAKQSAHTYRNQSRYHEGRITLAKWNLYFSFNYR